MSDLELSYDMGERGIVRLTSGVIQHIQVHIQNRWWHREAGGQLFAHIRSGLWTVECATGPRPSDVRSRFGFQPDRKTERQEIDAFFKNGLHYVGDWHTHAQDVPTPSNCDISTMADLVRKSEHSLGGFLLLIVGRSPLPEGLWTSLHLRDGTYQRLVVQ